MGYEKDKILRYYAGIGSRETPKEVLDLFIIVGKFLAQKGLTLRSGHAQGADQAFEIGCDKIKGKKEIYLPWKRFENSDSNLIVSKEKAFEIGAKFHPAWDRLTDGARKLQARNSHQILGEELCEPSDFVICWTKNGKGSGGTGQAIRIAKHYNVPVFDAGRYENIEDVKQELKLFLLDHKM